MDESKLDALARDVQKLTSDYWEMRSKVTELEARLRSISEMLEDAKQH
jgi:hypothetical protein